MTTRTPLLAFRGLPPEIREQIYSYSLNLDQEYKSFDEDIEFYRNVKTPLLLAALRGEPKLYHEALHYYYKHNTTRINSDKSDLYKFSHSLSLSVWSSICHLSVWPA